MDLSYLLKIEIDVDEVISIVELLKDIIDENSYKDLDKVKDLYKKYKDYLDKWPDYVCSEARELPNRVLKMKTSG